MIIALFGNGNHQIEWSMDFYLSTFLQFLYRTRRILDAFFTENRDTIRVTKRMGG